jgi:hypothetical protein
MAILELYPLATDKGQAIPLEAALPLASFKIATGASVANAVAIGALLQLFAPSTVRVAITDVATPSMSQAILPDSMYLPGGAIAVVSAPGKSIYVAAVDGVASVLYVNQIALWQSMARAQALENG